MMRSLPTFRLYHTDSVTGVIFLLHDGKIAAMTPMAGPRE
jgi:hypothetical protein